jgi:hypothetical protein
VTTTVCSPCRGWEKLHPIATCRQCQRTLACSVRSALCRFCSILLAETVSGVITGEQLWLGSGFTIRLSLSNPTYDGNRAVGRPRHLADRARAARRDRHQVSPHLIEANQLMLLPALHRRWDRLDRAALPALTEPAQHLITEFERHGHNQKWRGFSIAHNSRVLRILLAWLGATAPLHEVDVTAIARLQPDYNGLRVAQYLDTRGLLIPDPVSAVNSADTAVDRAISQLPHQFRTEITAWITVLRGQGRRRHQALLPTTIRRYVDHVIPALLDWSTRVDSLREVTNADVHDAVSATHGYARAQLQVTLRSLFRALKQERLIFHNPARGVKLSYPRRLPVPLPSDRLAGLVDKAPTHLVKLTIALVAIHALPGADIRRLRLDDLDRHHGQLTIARAGRTHVVYLDELTLNLATAWLQERTRRWPRTTNPHLLITQQSATDNRDRPMHAVSFRMLFAPRGITPSQLRIDRLYDEARHTADPVHLMRTFGISTNTAMTYLEATHPERARPDPTRA